MTTRTKDIVASCLVVAAFVCALIAGYQLGHEQQPAQPPFLNSVALGAVPSWDGETLYIVGNFTRAQGIDRNRIVAINVATGKVLPDFSADVNNEITGITLDHVNGYLTITGRFTVVNGVERLHSAVLRESDGVLLG